MHDPARILVVDDDPQIVRGLKLRLAAVGYDVSSALDGEKGLQSLSQFDPDVVIIDVRMPKMDGLEMLEQMRGPECDCRCRKIVLSANTPEKTRIAALALGVDYFVKKPFEFDSLDKLIRSLIQEPEPAHA